MLPPIGQGLSSHQPLNLGGEGAVLSSDDAHSACRKRGSVSRMNSVNESANVSWSTTELPKLAVTGMATTQPIVRQESQSCSRRVSTRSLANTPQT
jgi:hypothetical protein